MTEKQKALLKIYEQVAEKINILPLADQLEILNLITKAIVTSVE